MKIKVVFGVLFAVLLIAHCANAQVFNWTTVAGLVGTPAYADGTNSTAFFNHPTGTAVDAAGNVYVADANNYVIRELSQVGGNWVSTTIAGLAGNNALVDGTNNAARFNSLGALQIDSLGNLYVFDSSRVRKISPVGTNWVITTVYNQSSGGWAVDASGNYYTASNQAIIQLAPGTNGAPSPTNYVATVLAGFPGISGNVDGTNNVARFYNPSVFSVNTNGIVFVGDNYGLHKVVAVEGNWVASTMSSASYSYTCRDKNGNFYGVNNQSISQLPINSSNWVTIGGNVFNGGSIDGTNTMARFSSPVGLSVDSGGNVFVADFNNNTIRMGTIIPTGSLQVSLAPAGAVAAGAQWQVDGGSWQTNGTMLTNVLAGSHTVSFTNVYGWTTPSNQIVNISSNLLTSTTGIYIQQFGSVQVNINPSNAVVAGAQWQVDGGAWQNSGMVVSNISVGFHTLTFASLPGWMTASNIPITVNFGQTTVTNVTYAVAYNWTTIAGLYNTPSFADGTNNNAYFRNPTGMAADGAGNVYVTDANNYCIRKISLVGSNWVTTTIAGLGGTQGTPPIDGTGSSARFYQISYLQLDGIGNIYVQDNNPYGSPLANGSLIRKITPVGTNWVVTTIYRLWNSSSGWAVDAYGNFYTASNYSIIQLSPVVVNGVASATNYVATTLAGFPGLQGSADGLNNVARFLNPSVFGVDSTGTIYINDNGSKIRTASPSGGNWSVVTTPVSPYSYQVLDVGGNIYGTANYNVYELLAGTTNWISIGGSNGVSGYADGINIQARFNSPQGVAVNSRGTLYVADYGNQLIRQGSTASTPLGGLQVSLQPGNAVIAGAAWKTDAGLWQTNGATITSLMAGGGHMLAFAPVYGWVTPSNQWVAISNNATTMVTANYIQQYGSLQVNLTPAGAASGGAAWQLDGGPWQTSGTIVSNLTIGTHTVAFTNVIGFITPAAQTTVNITPNQTTVISGDYVALGAVTVNINPAGAVSAGAQWQLDSGPFQNSGVVISNVSLGSHTISFVPVFGWITPSNQTVTVNSGQTNTVTANYVVLGSLQVTINPAGAVSGGAQWQVDSNGWQNSGNVVSNLATGLHTISYSPATGYIAPTNQTLNINPGGTTNIAATYVALGTVFVSITPTNAVSGGAQWALDGGVWQNSGSAAINVSLGSHTISYLPTTGFITPSNQVVTVVSGSNNFSVNYTALGAVLVNINPTNAVNAGAQWALDGGTWQNSGTIVSNVALGSHTVSYLPATGFITPSNFTVTVVSGQTTNVNATYIALGNVQVTIVPNSAVTNGAQWQIDGGAFQNSGTTLSNLTLGAHTIAYSTVNGFFFPSYQVVTVVSGQTTNVTGVYVPTGTVQVFITPIGAISAGALWRLDGGIWMASGSSWMGVAATTNHTVSFTNIAGWTAPTNLTVTVNLNQTSIVTGVYVQQFGNLQVVLSPAGAVSEGAQWQVDSGAWQTSGATLTNVTVGNHTLAFAGIAGWTAPTNQIVAISSNQTTRLTAIYQGMGSLQVMIVPTGAIVSGGQWQVDGGTWMSNGMVVSGLSRGTHTVAYKPASGWVAPASQSVSILANQTSVTNGVYTGLGYNFTTIAGTVGTGAFRDGTNLAAWFDTPVGICVDVNSNLYVADTGNSVIRKLTLTTNGWISSTIAGLAGYPGNADGTNSQARFDYPSGVAVDTNGNLYVADQVNSTVRKMTTDGTNWTVSTIAGLAGNYGSSNGTNGVARFYYPAGLAVDATGNLYVADQINSTIRKLTPLASNNWAVTTIAGTAGVNGSTDGTNNASRFYWPSDLTVDANGNLFAADTFNNTIRKISPVGTNYVTTTICGIAGVNNSVDGTNNSALFDGLGGIALDAFGNLFVADSYSSVIRKITPVGTNWVVNTIGGLAYVIGAADGTNSLARFDTPYGLCVDGNGVVYVADTYNQTIRAGSTLFPVPAKPNMVVVVPPGKSFAFNWQATAGLTYQVQFTTNLQAAWVNIGASILATNTVIPFVDTSATNDQRFYRVKVMP